MSAELFAAGVAVDVLEEFIALHDRVRSDPDVALAELHSLARGAALEWASEDIRADRERGRYGIGRQELVDIEVVRVVLDEDDVYPRVVVSSCLDRSGLDIVDHDGNPVQRREPARVAVDWVLHDMDSSTNHWLVTETTLSTGLSRQPC